MTSMTVVLGLRGVLIVNTEETLVSHAASQREGGDVLTSVDFS